MADKKTKKQDNGPVIQARTFLSCVQCDITFPYPCVVSETIPAKTRATLSASYKIDRPDELSAIIRRIPERAAVRSVIQHRHIIYIDIRAESFCENKPDDEEKTKEYYEKHMPALISRALLPVF